MLTSQVNAGPRDELALLKLTPLKRRRVFRSAGRKVRRESRDRLKTQTDLRGKKWQARADGRKKRMLAKVARRVIVKTSTENAQVKFTNASTAKIANVHQQGIEQTMTASDMQRIHGTPDYRAPATRKQAKRLLAAGYKIRRSQGKGFKRPTIKWIVENLSQGKAGFVLRLLEESKPKRRWKLKTPQRSFLGQSQQEQIELKNLLLDEAMRLSN